MHPAINQISQLPVSEQLEIVQQLWDNIASARESFTPQQWHRELVASRSAEFAGREDELGLSREEVWSRVLDRHDS